MTERGIYLITRALTVLSILSAISTRCHGLNLVSLKLLPIPMMQQWAMHRTWNRNEQNHTHIRLSIPEHRSRATTPKWKCLSFFLNFPWLQLPPCGSLSVPASPPLHPSPNVHARTLTTLCTLDPDGVFERLLHPRWRFFLSTCQPLSTFFFFSFFFFFFSPHLFNFHSSKTDEEILA